MQISRNFIAQNRVNMRIIMTAIIMILFTTIKAQTTFPGSFQNTTYGSTSTGAINGVNSNTQKKWFISRYTGITTGYTFFNHGGAGFLAAPVGLQLNRR